MIRIVSGKLKGRQLNTRKGDQTRPTLSKTRDAIFNMLESRYYLDEFDVIDLFVEVNDAEGNSLDIVRSVEPGMYGIDPEQFYL